jgi:4-amino-4-deoxy-L-arabinose transferase-like glycosyltransferase
MPSAAPDDDEIGQLAAEPERPLFPLLARAEAMIPLVVVLAFLPPLYAVRHRTLTATGAWEGLLSQRYLAVANLADAVDSAQLAPHNPLRFQPPLMNWLTALSRRLFGVGNAMAIVAPAYLCTAGLIVAGYVLARRIGGEPLGLVAAALLAFNPLILDGAQEAVPQSLVCLLAVLSLAGIAAHWQESADVVSYPLLLGGLSLGLCLLAGGPVALAVVVILLVYALLWKVFAWLQVRRRGSRERSPFHRRPAIRSIAMLAATAFAVGGWYPLLMSARYGRDFWVGWWTTGGARALEGAPWTALFLEGAWELNRLALPVFGLALVGLIGIIRDLYRAEQDPTRQHRGLLVVWIAAALATWIFAAGPARTETAGARTWEAFLAVPVVIAAAMGLLDIAERRISFLLSLAFGLLAVGGAALMAGQYWKGPPGDEEMLELWGLNVSLPNLATLAILAGGGMILARFALGRDRRQRLVLTGLLAVIVLANCAWGIFGVRRANAGDRELEELRSGLARLPAMNACTFVALAPAENADPAQPPPALVYVVGCVWPQAGMRFTTSWEGAADQLATEPSATPATVFVSWSPRGRPRSAAPSAGLKSAAAPFHYQDLEIVAYVRDAAS